MNSLLWAKGHFAKACFLCSHAEQEIKKKKSPQPVAQTEAVSGGKVKNKVKTLCLILNFGSQVENWKFQGQTERKTIWSVIIQKRLLKGSQNPRTSKPM